MLLRDYISSDVIYQEMTERTENPHQIDPDHLSGAISNLFRSVNSGTITIDIDKQPFLRFIINQGNRVGQKFIEMLLVRIIKIGTMMNGCRSIALL